MHRETGGRHCAAREGPAPVMSRDPVVFSGTPLQRAQALIQALVDAPVGVAMQLWTGEDASGTSVVGAVIDGTAYVFTPLETGVIADEMEAARARMGDGKMPIAVPNLVKQLRRAADEARREAAKRLS